MKILTVVGARPQFIKTAVVSYELRKKHTEILVHTGQHYDYNMSELFFKELDISVPDYNLGIAGGTHAQMTGKMMESIEAILIKERPDVLLVYGDTNSTLAGALAAAKIHVPVCHMEAGVRAYNRNNPEEINRICTDHISTLLLACTQNSLDNLKREGLQDRGILVGDPMYDVFLRFSKKIKPENLELRLLSGDKIFIRDKYFYLTCHREENTKNDKTLYEIFQAMDRFKVPVIYPVHPRNKERAVRLKAQYHFSNLILLEPVGYLESIWLVSHAQAVVTDSGGLQREAFFSKRKCVTILDFACWPETMVDGRNESSSPNADEIFCKLNNPQYIDDSYMPFGDGNSSEKIANMIETILGSERK